MPSLTLIYLNHWVALDLLSAWGNKSSFSYEGRIPSGTIALNHIRQTTLNAKKTFSKSLRAVTRREGIFSEPPSSARLL